MRTDLSQTPNGLVSRACSCIVTVPRTTITSRITNWRTEYALHASTKDLTSLVTTTLTRVITTTVTVSTAPTATLSVKQYCPVFEEKGCTYYNFDDQLYINDAETFADAVHLCQNKCEGGRNFSRVSDETDVNVQGDKCEIIFVYEDLKANAFLCLVYVFFLRWGRLTVGMTMSLMRSIFFAGIGVLETLLHTGIFPSV